MTSFFTMRSQRFPNRETGATGIVRGLQIAERMGPEKARCNPEDNYSDDICIYIKQAPDWSCCPERTYIDVVDHFYLFHDLKKNAGKYKIIASTKVSQDYISRSLRRNDILLIPQQHCNFNNEKRSNREVKTVGIIGSYSACELDIEELKSRLAKIGMTLEWYVKPRFRNSVVRFLRQKVDVQFVYRENRTKKGRVGGTFLTSMKLANASSFGIPTVAYPEPSFDNDFPDAYMRVYNMDMAIDAIKELKDNPKLYSEIATKANEISQQYHIDKIIKYYEELK